MTLRFNINVVLPFADKTQKSMYTNFNYWHVNMGIYNIFIVSKSGGLIYHYDHNIPQRETEKTFSFPLDIKLELDGKRVSVVFGERDGIRIGHTLLR